MPSAGDSAVPGTGAYRDFLDSLNGTYAKVRRVLGLNGFSMARGFNSYAKMNRMPFRAKWGVRKKDILTDIRRMLSEDIPVVLSVGPNLVPGRKNPGVNFYPAEDKTRSQSVRVLDHYVTVTGVEKEDDKIFLQIYSWGKMYLVDFDEYMRYIKSQPPLIGSLVTSILCVTRSF